MLEGTVRFNATIKGKGNGVTFPLFEFNPRKSGIEKVEIGAPNGNEIRTKVHFTTVASRDEALVRATEVNTAALNRIAFRYNLAIETARMTGDQFSRVDSPPGVLEPGTGGYALSGGESRLLVGLPADTVKAELEHEVLPGEHNYGLFRSAGLAESPVEEFMLLHNLLLMLHNDSQGAVDAFIVREDPGVTRTPSPHIPGATETVYTRLRNELGHTRSGVNLDNTRSDMARTLDGPRALTKRAIELHP
jgi:hypothetical protein